MNIGTIPMGNFDETLDAMASGSIPFGVAPEIGIPDLDAARNRLFDAIEAELAKVQMTPMGEQGRTVGKTASGTEMTLDATVETVNGSTIMLIMSLDDRLNLSVDSSSGVSVQDGDSHGLGWAIPEEKVGSMADLASALEELREW